MNRRSFVRSAALVPLGMGSLRPSFADGLSTREETRPLGTPALAASGQLQERYATSLNRVLSGDSPAYSEEFLLDDLRPTVGRRFTEFSGDLSGRYIGALATAARVHGTSFPGLDTLVVKAIALQKPDGYFGRGFHYDKPTDDDLALLWGNGRLLVGLLEYYQLAPSAAVLDVCRRLGDWLVRIGPLMLSKQIRDAFGAQHFASSYICWTQQVEGLANLYRVTRVARYRELAEAIAAVTERRPGDHVHGYLTSVRGWVDLQAATGDGALLARCEAAWKDVAESQDLLITGGVPEGWSPNNHRTEGCGEADWLRLSLALWKATGKAEYLRMAEKTLFNEFAFNQFETGDFGHRVYTETGLPAAGAVRAWWCCTLHGLRAFPDVQTAVFRRGKDGVSYDLPLEGTLGTDSVTVTADSSLANDGTIRIAVSPVAGRALDAAVIVAIRKPEWVESLTVAVNGVRSEAGVEDGYLRLRRVWRAGDVVTVRYGMSLRSEPAGKDRVAYWYGPWLLGAPASENVAYFNEQTIWNRLSGAAGRPGTPTKESGRLRIPVAANEFSYIPSEFPGQPGVVSLRALAEQAGQPTTSWELRFLTSGATKA